MPVRAPLFFTLFMNIKIVLVVLLVCFSSQLKAVSFTADAVQIRGDNVSRAKMYWLDGNVRFEYVENGVAIAQIFDNKNNKIIWLDRAKKTYLKKEMPENDRVISNKSKKATDPCKQFAGAECLFLKRTKLNGREADKWLITLDNEGGDFHIFQWIDAEYKNIIRQQNSDGSGLSVEIEDGKKVNGRDVRKLTMIAYSANGEKQQGVQWYDNKLDIVVKQQYQLDVIDELQNIKVGEVSKNLFTIPKGFSEFTDETGVAQKSAGEGRKKDKN